MFYKFSRLAYLCIGALTLSFAGEATGQSLSQSGIQGNQQDNYLGSNVTSLQNNVLDSEEESVDAQSTSSLTAGYASDEFNLQTDEGSWRYRFKGELATLMLSSSSSYFMLGYGTAPAEEDEGDIRSITVDLQTGGNISLFENFLSLPIKTYIPVRFNMGYRNLALLNEQSSAYGENANIGSGGVGAGLGGQVRIPTGLPWLEDNLTGIISLVRSVGGLGDLSRSTNQDNFGSQEGDSIIEGVRLTQNTDFNLEGKFERLLDSNIGATAGITFRWSYWTDEPADNFGQLVDVAMGEQEGLNLRATQSLLRVGINW